MIGFGMSKEGRLTTNLTKEQSTQSDHGLAQGAATSPILANLEMDK